MIAKNEFKIIYISYDSLTEPLGMSQILPYLIELKKTTNIELLSFEKNLTNNLAKINELNTILLKKKIKWKIIKYNKSSYLITKIYKVIYLNFYFLIKILFEKKIIFHLRSYIPYFFIMLPINIKKVDFIFDMRGFWFQEKIDRRGWNSKSFFFKFLESFEKKILYNSKKILCLTDNSIKILKMKYPSINFNKYSSIRTGVDEKRFNYTKKKLDLNNLIFCYLGTTDGAYDFDMTVKVFIKFKNKFKNAKLKIISKDNIGNIKNQLKSLRENIDYEIKNIDFDKISDEINTIDIGIFILKNNLSIKASFPTKIAELFICNKPIICNNFNEDIADIINSRTGFLFNEDLSDLSTKNIQVITDLLINNNKYEYCRDYALKNLTISKIIPKILNSYL